MRTRHTFMIGAGAVAGLIAAGSICVALLFYAFPVTPPEPAPRPALLGVWDTFLGGFQDQGLREEYWSPEYVAAVETRIWQAYYAHEHEKVFVELIGLLHSVFGLSYQNALLAGLDFCSAGKVFLEAESDYEYAALPYLERAYMRVCSSIDEDWDAPAAARAELAWWMARRTPERNNIDTVGQEIARLYALLCGGTNADIQMAGMLRAQAAALRDLQGKNTDWNLVREMLEESYRALLRGILED